MRVAVIDSRDNTGVLRLAVEDGMGGQGLVEPEAEMRYSSPT